MFVAVVVIVMLAAGACTQEPERSVEAFCAQIRAVQNIDEVIESGDTARIDAQLAQFRTAQMVAPTDIEPQVGVLVRITDELSRAMATAKSPDLAASEVFARPDLDRPAIEAAGTAVQRYAADKCQVQLKGGA
jgi:hypothetical protein